MKTLFFSSADRLSLQLPSLEVISDQKDPRYAWAAASFHAVDVNVLSPPWVAFRNQGAQECFRLSSSFFVLLLLIFITKC